MKTSRVLSIALALALGACAAGADERGSVGSGADPGARSTGEAGAGGLVPPVGEVSSPVAVDGPGARGPETAVAMGVDSDEPIDLEADPEPQPDEPASWPELGAGASVSHSGDFASAADSEPAASSGVNIADDAPVVPAYDAPEGVEVSSQALTLSTTTQHVRSHQIGGWPHEPTLSLGRSHMVIATRGAITIVSKGNDLLYRDTANNFFAALNTRTEEMFDCRAVYAPSQQRHVFMCLQNWLLPGGGGCKLDSPNCSGQILFAVSKDAYPNRPSDFYMWRSPNTDTDGSTATRNDGDYPFLGVTNDMLIVSKLMRVGNAAGGGWHWIDDVRVFSLADLAAGEGFDTLRQWSWWGDAFKHGNERVVGVVPAIHWGASGTAYMVSRRPGVANGMLLWSIKDPFLSTRSLSVQTVSMWQNQNPPCGANQTPAANQWSCTEGQPDNNAGDGITPARVVSHADGRFYTPTFRNDRLWWVRDQVATLDGLQKGVVRFGLIDTTNLTVLADNNVFLAGTGNGLAGVAATSTNDALIPFIRTGGGAYPSVRAGMLDRNVVWNSSINVRTASFPFVTSGPAPYDVGVSVAAEPSEDAAWLVTQYPDRAPTAQNDWNVGLVFAKMGGTRKADLTVPNYGSHQQLAITEHASVNRGSSLTATVRVENFGDTTSATVPVTLYLSTNSTITSGDTRLGSANIGPLASGAWSGVSITGTVPAAQATGTYYLGAIIGSQTEYDTGNNTRANDTTTVVR